MKTKNTKAAATGIALALILSACATPNMARPHYVEFDNEDPKSFCAKALSAFASHPEQGRVETFKGEVKRGEKYEHKFGGNFFFKLTPTPAGWAMQITTAANESPDLAQVATPPYSLANPRLISTEHHTAKQATEWNSRGACFVLNAADYIKAKAASDIVLRP